MRPASEARGLSGHFAGSSRMAARMRSLDWSATPLGPVEGWPQSLRSALSICLGSRFPIAIYWGSELALLYNDDWSPILGSKHPRALGLPAREVWPEIWRDIGPLFRQVMTAGEATYSEDALLPMRRHGYTEECYFNFTFSPIRGEGGLVEGVFNAVIETTYRVIAERRARVLRDMAERTAPARSPDEACRLAASALSTADRDVSFCAIYRVEEGASTARLAAASGVTPGGPAAPSEMPLSGDPIWPLERAAAGLQVVDRLEERLGALPGGAWPEPAGAAFVVPMPAAPGGAVPGFVVLGASPRRAVDGAYREFAERVAGQLAQDLASAKAYEAERRRAEALAELDRAKTVFFSNISHELRTPLTLLLGPVENAMATADRVLRKDDLELVHRGALRLQKLVNTLLSFARIEAGRLEASFEPVDLARYTADLASVFRAAVERAGLAFDVDAPPLPESVYVDPDLWEKIVLNLLSNALKHTFEGSIRVALKAAGDRVRLEVADTGVGIPESELPRLFERFHRVQGARSRSHEGSGIGLALVHELVRLHGGTLGVESRPGKGTTFRIELPKGRAHLPAGQVREGAARPSVKDAASFLEEARSWMGGGDSPALAPTLARGEADAVRTRGGRIVLADDNADIRDYLRRLLEPHWTVEAVANGREALAAIARRVPDLVLSDVMMPELDGLGLLRILREDPRTRTVPVILVSARAGEEATTAGLGEGADDYLVKPFTRQELLARVDAHIRLSRLRKEGEKAIRDSEASLRARSEELLAVMETVPAIVWVARDPRGASITGNRMSYELLRLDPGANASLSAGDGDAPRHFRIFHGGEELGPEDLPIQRALREKRPIRGFEERIVFSDGTSVDLIGSVELLHGDGGKVRGAVAAFVDITKLKAVEAEIRELNQTLERRVEERTRSLREALHELETFSYTVAHDLRAPLRAVSGFANLLREDHIPRGDEVGQGFALRLVQAAERMDALVLDLLDYSRLARKDLPLSREDPREAVDDVLQRLEPELARRGARVMVDGPMHPVLANPVALRQALVNLIDNATKFVPAGRPPIVRLRSELRGRRVRLWVEDNGIGIAPEHFSQVFGVFQRLHRSEDYPGTGIGLAIVKKSVEKMGGEVGVESTVGEGSRFYVELAGVR